MAVDLGTYHLRVIFTDGSGYIEQWRTGRRYSHGRGEVSPLHARLIQPTWSSEDDLLHSMEWAYTEGNYSCDCNRILNLAHAHQRPEPDDVECGDSIILATLTAIRPDGSEVELKVTPT